MCVSVRVRARVCKEIYLPSASWKLWEAGSAVQSKSQGPRTRAADGISLSSKAGEDECISSSSQAEKEFSIPPPFGLVRPSLDWRMPIHIEEGVCLTESTDSNVNLTQKQAHRYPQKCLANVLAHHHLLKLTHKIKIYHK